MKTHLDIYKCRYTLDKQKKKYLMTMMEEMNIYNVN